MVFAGIYPVHELKITGNKRTKGFVIERELLVSLNESYPETGDGNITSLLLKSQDRVLNLNLFNTVNITYELLQGSEGKNYVVTIAVVEKWYVWPIPFVEFSDRNFNVWGNLNFNTERTNYGLYVFNYNMFGRNHTLKTKMKTGYNSKLGLEYRIPFISRKTQWGINTLIERASQNEVWYQTRNDSLQFFQNGNKNIIQTTKAHVILSKRLNPFTQFFCGVNFQHGQLDTAVPTDDYFINNQRFQRDYGINAELRYDQRNNIYFPTKGKYLSVQIETSAWQNSGTVYNASITSKAQRFDKLSNKWYSALSVYGQYNTQKNAPYANRKILGYDEIVRGYEHYVIDGTVGWKTNAALRYNLMEKDIGLKFIPIKNYQVLPLNVFVEGYLENGFANFESSDASNKLNANALFSMGLGVSTIFYNDRILRIEYSLNSLREGGFFVHFKKAI